jgi:hypothetical protein
MATHVEQIHASITNILTTAGLTLRLDTDALYSFENKPVIVIDVGNETPDPVGTIGAVYWNLTIALLIGAEGPVPKLAPETTRKAAHAALYVDRSLGGLVVDIMAGPVNRAIDAENPAAGITEAIYQLKYRTQESVL